MTKATTQPRSRKPSDEQAKMKQDYLEALTYLTPKERAELDALMASMAADSKPHDKSSLDNKMAVIAEPTYFERSLGKLHVVESEGRSAVVAQSFIGHGFDGLTTNGCVAALVDSGKRVEKGDLGGLERTLAAQTVALDVIFSSLAMRANSSKDFDVFERYLRLAFRAQSQCRATVEALAEIKNPRAATFVRQANVGQNVQVNNGKSRASKKGIQKTELLEAGDGERLDTGTEGPAIGTHSRLEAVGAVDRTAKRRR